MTGPSKYPWMALVPSSVVVNLATIGPVGYWGKAPGTNGSVVGLLLYTVAFHGLPLALQLLLAGALAYLAVIFCDEAERRLFKQDPGEIILDEIVAVPIVFLGLNVTMAQTGHVWAYMLAGLVLFRVFDILKPFGIKRLQNLPGGLGVVVDDLVAGLASAVVLRLILWGLVAGELLSAPAA